MKPCKNIISVHLLFSILVILTLCYSMACSIKLKDDDVYKASGTYIFDYVSGGYYLFLYVDKSDFPDTCEIDRDDQIQFQRVEVGSTEMILPASNDSDFFSAKHTFDRSEDGTAGDIEGTWEVVIDEDDDIVLEITFDADRSFKLEARNLSCDDFIDDDGDDDDDDQGFDNVDGTWDLVFQEEGASTSETLTYELKTEGNTFTLIREDAEETDDWYRWEGTASVNTYSHYKITSFEYYQIEGDDEAIFDPGTYTSTMQFTMTAEDELEDGTLTEHWAFDNGGTSAVTRTYSFTGAKAE